MLTRTNRGAITFQPGQKDSRNNCGSLILLRIGCPRPTVQHLHKSDEVGLGQAMGLAEDGNSSDLGSGAIMAGKGVEWHERVGRGDRYLAQRIIGVLGTAQEGSL